MKTKHTISKSARCMLLAMFLTALSWTGAFAQNCKADFTLVVTGNSVAFTNTSTGSQSASYFWEFGDGNYDSAKNPVHSYTNKGTYFVDLFMYDSLMNCSDSTYRTFAITTGCNPLSVTISSKNPSSPSSCDGAISITGITGGVAPYVYTWSPKVSNSSSANNLCYGLYNITVTDANGCTGDGSTYIRDSSNTDHCGVNVNLFQDSTNSNPLLWYAYPVITGGIFPFTYQWSFGDGSTSTQESPSHSYATAGHYAICLTIKDAAGCTSSSCDSTYRITQGGLIKDLIVVPHQTGIKENSLTVTSVFPNPANDRIEVALSQFTQGQLMITDIAGREVYNQKINANNIKVDVSNFVRGCYTLSIVYGQKTMHSKIMIAR